MQDKKVYDIIGIGIGPFNLGLAALCYNVPELSCLFIDQQEGFNWHPGLMIPGTRLQVPFYADLVTLADPCSPFSFMAFLKSKQRLFRFAIRENYFVTRKEYNEYCQWVCTQLPSLQFNCRCESISNDDDGYKVITTKGELYAKNIVLGIGSLPSIPSFAKTADHPFVFHSSDYLNRKDQLLTKDSITIVGSGQSAAEIFHDLLQFYPGELYWFTRSERFLPMDYSKLTLEMSSPDYIDHFYSLPESMKTDILSKQDTLYKGINHSLIGEIYDCLHENWSTDRIHLHTNCELQSVQTKGSILELGFYHKEVLQSFRHKTNSLILATGYKSATPDFMSKFGKNMKANRNYSIDANNTIFVQNAEIKSHGFTAADLGLGPYRNATILNTILKREHFTLEKNICFQSFGLPNQ